MKPAVRNFISVQDHTAQYARWPVYIIVWLQVIISTFILHCYTVSNMLIGYVYF